MSDYDFLRESKELEKLYESATNKLSTPTGDWFYGTIAKIIAERSEWNAWQLVRQSQLDLLGRLEETPGENIDVESDYSQLRWAITREREAIEQKLNGSKG